MKYFAFVLVISFFVAVYNFYNYDLHKNEKCTRSECKSFFDNSIS